MLDKFDRPIFKEGGAYIQGGGYIGDVHWVISVSRDTFNDCGRIYNKWHLEYSNRQVKFRSEVAVLNWYFKHYRYFNTFNKHDLYKMLVKRNSKFDDP